MTTCRPSRRRPAIAVARVAAAVAALAVALAPAAEAADSFGAIAYSPDGTWGRSHGYPTRAAAEATAVKSCGAECKVLITFTECGAVAAKDREYKGGTGRDLNAAMKDAQSKLPGGYIDTWACNN